MKSSEWRPRLAETAETAHDRLVAALSEDIARGALTAGTRLPPHRELGAALGLSVATVTKAYGTLQRRGLVRAEAGRGTFVCAGPERAGHEIDFSINMPPAELSGTALSRLSELISSGISRGGLSRYEPAAGTAEQRELLCRLLREMRGIEAAAGSVFLTSSAQHALFAAMSAAPAGAVGAEALTYPGALRIFRQLGRPVMALAMDEEGVTPAALREALASATPPKIISLVPTLQNPTGATMSGKRRDEIARIARDNDLMILEDDIYACFAPPDLPPFANLIPERTLYVSSLSKCMTPGLRIGYLKVPEALAGTCLSWLEATSSMNHPVSGIALKACVEQKLSQSTAAAMKAEVALRSSVADEILPNLLSPVRYASLHRWIPMPANAARRIVAAASAAGLKLAPPEAFMADPDAGEAGIRLCLGNVPGVRLREALVQLRALLSAPPGRSHGGAAPI